MKLIAYLRVSSDGQVDGFGLETQEDAIRDWCRHHQHRIVDVVSDVGVSGASDAIDRSGFSSVLTSITSGNADGLVVARLDRLARALTVQEAALALLWRYDAEVFAADVGRILRDDPDDPMRTALRQVVGIFSELERRAVVKRLKDGRAAKAASGRKAVGAYAYGFRGAGKGQSRDAAPHPEEQKIVSRVKSLRDQGCSYRQIARQLDLDGHRPRRAEAWSPMVVRSIALRAGE